jgi:restriction system protein
VGADDPWTIRRSLAKQLGLTEDELAEMLPSGQPAFYNRVHWARTYLAQAKLLENTRRAHFRITERGREVLREKPDKVDVRLLERFPEFNEFKLRAREAQTGGRDPATLGRDSALQLRRRPTRRRTTSAGVPPTAAV